MNVDQILDQLFELIGPNPTEPQATDEEISAYLNGLDLEGLGLADLNQIHAVVEELGIKPGVTRMKGAIDAAKNDELASAANEVIERQRAGEAPTPDDDKVIQEAREAGVDLEQFQPDDPLWLVEMNGGRYLTPEQREDVLDAIEFNTGTRPIDLFEAEEMGLLNDPTTQRIIEATVTAAAPLPTTSIDLGKGDLFTVRNDELDFALQTYGYTDKQFASTIRLANAHDLRRADGQGIAWQPLAAALAASEFFAQTEGPQGRAEAAAQELAELRAKLRGFEIYGGTDAQKSQIEARIADLQRERSLAAQSTRWASQTPRYIIDRYKSGIELYGGDEGLAFLHSLDEGLAARLKASGGDPDMVTWQDGRQIGMLLSRAGFGSREDMIRGLVGQGYGEAAGSSILAEYLAIEKGAGGGGATRIAPDPVQVTQAAKDFYRQLFLEEPDEGTLSSFSSQIQAMISGAPDDQNVDVNARIRQIAEGLPQYEKYYGKKPGGMTEASYQNQFLNAQSSMLGQELAGYEPTKVGMQSGKYQTTVGASLGTEEAWDNSTFMGRLARGAQTVSRNT